MVSGTFPGSPKFVSEQLVIAPHLPGSCLLGDGQAVASEGSFLVQGRAPLKGCAQEPRVT